MGPLLYTHLNALAPASVPKPVFVEWWRRYEHHARRNTELAGRLAQVARDLEDHGIPCVPYKGPLLAQSLYGSLAFRAFDDIDLLIRRADLARAKPLLMAAGYEPYYHLEPDLEAAMVRSHLQYHLIFVHASPEHLLEVHWKTDPAFPVEQDDPAWWNGLPTTTLAGQTVRTFRAEESLLTSCLHAMRHHGYRLCWLADVAEALRQQPELNWPGIIDRARQMKSWRRLAVAVTIAHDVLEAPVPGVLLDQAQADPAVGRLAARIARRLFERDAGDLGVLERLRLDLALFDRASDRAKHLLSVALEPSFHEWSALPLPRPLYPLYLPLRAARLAGKYVVRRSWRDGRTAPAGPAGGGAARE